MYSIQCNKFEPKLPSKSRVKRSQSSSFSHCNGKLQSPIQSSRTAVHRPCLDRCHLYIDCSPPCQPRCCPLDATHLLDASDAPFTHPARSILARQSSTALRHCSASYSALTVTLEPSYSAQSSAMTSSATS